MLAPLDRPPFDDRISIAALGILADAGRVTDASRILERYGPWIAQLPEELAPRLHDIGRKFAALQAIEDRHGSGAAMNLDHPAMIRELKRHARSPFLEEEHLENAGAYRRSKVAAAGTTSEAKSSWVS